MKLTALAIVSVAACTSPDYGSPTATTEIAAHHGGGFVQTPTFDGVHIVGSVASFTQDTRTATAAVTLDNLSAIIGALEDIQFLDLDQSYVTCNTPASDAATVNLEARLTGGTNQVSFYGGCPGGIYDKLGALETTILDKSGYTTWTQLDQ